ncbi:MAG: hypothetical protein AAF489_13200 [Bacteroidota bacterium]
MKFKPFSTGPISALCILLILMVTLGCDETKKTEGESKEVLEAAVVIEPSQKNVHVAFAGGGWRAHTGHSAWVISLLQNGKLSLEDAFGQVGVIGSNSGGTWFSTMLALSNNFVTDIEAGNAIVEWPKTGWLGKQHDLFVNTSGCDKAWDYWYAYTLCVLDKNDNDSGDWASIVEKIIYEGYPLGTTTLKGPRQTWANDKTLLAAGSMLTSNVLLNAYGKDLLDDKRHKYQYYQACLNPATPDLGTFRMAATCANDPGKLSEVTPVIFSGLPTASKDAAPSFLPVLEGGGFYNVGYSEAILDDDPDSKTIPISNPTDNDNVLAVHAASASSAALGFLSYVRAYNTWSWGDAYENRLLAPSFSLDGSVKLADTEKLTVETLASEKIVRIADGGPVDNSGVAQIVKYLQLNGSADGFNIVAFDNVTSSFSAGSGAAVGPDIANLFGKGLCGDSSNKFCVEGCGITNDLAGCVYIPKIQIFEEGALTGTSHTWKANDGNMELIYTKYEVTTVENPNFNITANSTGTLHSFTCVAPNAGTVPTDSKFTGYTDMFNFIHTQLNDSSGKGLGYLKSAFDLK